MPQTESTAEQAILGAYSVDRSAPVSFVAGADGNRYLRQVVTPTTPLPVSSPSAYPRFMSGAVNFTPAANATDFARIGGRSYTRIARVGRIVISGTATSASVLDLLVQRSVNGGGGTSAVRTPGFADLLTSPNAFEFYTYSANRTSGGNGIDTTRHLLAAQKLYLGTASAPSDPVVIEFKGDNRPMLRGTSEWVVLNLNGQAIPAGTSLDITVEWTEEPAAPLYFAGDSTTSNAVYLFEELGRAAALPRQTNMLNAGSNGMRLQDVLLNTSSPAYPLVGANGILDRMDGMPSVMVFCYGLNDLRQGAVTRDQLISMIDAAIYATLNGTTSGATYTSPMGAGTTFTWPATIEANPDCQIILWSPNSLTTDGNGASYVVLSGRFASNTVAEAAQIITDDLREAYEAFRNDSRIFRLVHKQDIFGTTSTTLALSGHHANAQGVTKNTEALMTDILHPNARGQVLSARQIAPHIVDALAAAEFKVS